MRRQISTDQQAVQEVVREINEHWRAKRYDLIGALLGKDAVIASPGFEHRIRGREAYVQSYRDYDDTATTLEFDAGSPEVDVVDDVAVAVYPFHVIYEIGGTTFREHGHDVLVLSRTSGSWKVVWRTMQVNPADENAASIVTPVADE